MNTLTKVQMENIISYYDNKESKKLKTIEVAVFEIRQIQHLFP